MLAVIILSGCAQAAKSGDKIQVHYTGKLSDGTTFDSSVGKAPLEVTLGSGMFIPGFEKAVLGMRAGEKKTVTIAAADAYGPRMDNLIVEMPLSKFPSDITPKVGLELEMYNSEGASIYVKIIKVTDTAATLDANNPLAGKDLIFDIELVKIL